MIYTFTDTEIKNALKQAPAAVADTVFAIETASQIREITTEQNIRNDQKPVVAEEVLFTFLQLTSVDEMRVRLAERLGVDDKKAHTLVDALLERVLAGHHVRAGTPQQKTPEPKPPVQTYTPSAQPSTESLVQESVVPASSGQTPERIPRGLPTHQIPEQILKEAGKPQVHNDVSQEDQSSGNVQATKDTPPHTKAQESAENPSVAVPRYAKPLTDTPKYDVDPYHEPIE